MTPNNAEDTLLNQLTKALDENGNIEELTRKRLTLMALRAVYTNTTCLPEMKNEIENLKRKSIVIWIEKHQKLATFISLFTLITVFIMFTVWTEIGISAALSRILGF